MPGFFVGQQELRQMVFCCKTVKLSHVDALDGINRLGSGEP
jgi:hypothetical protein